MSQLRKGDEIMDDLTQNAAPHYPRSDRPLFGLTVLVVEDSKFAGLIACALQDAIFRCTALQW